MIEAGVAVRLLSVTSSLEGDGCRRGVEPIWVEVLCYEEYIGFSSVGNELSGSSSVDMQEDCDEEQAVVQKGGDGDQGSPTFAILLRASCTFVSLMPLAFVCRWFCQKCTASRKHVTSPH